MMGHSLCPQWFMGQDVGSRNHKNASKIPIVPIIPIIRVQNRYKEHSEARLFHRLPGNPKIEKGRHGADPILVKLGNSHFHSTRKSSGEEDSKNYTVATAEGC